ncbi:MAG: KEOPS complex subunit Cgi121 [Candidatus Bathyarchaeia archaeon]
MIFRVEEYDKFIVIVGLRGPKIGDIDQTLTGLRTEFKGVQVQLFDADRVAGPRHLFFAAFNALKAFSQGQNVSKSLAVEALLYASGQRQIVKAIKMLGVKPDTSNVAVLAVSSTEGEALSVEEAIARLIGGVRDDRVLDVDDSKACELMKLFGLTELAVKTRDVSDEKRAVSELIVEIGALLATKL